MFLAHVHAAEKFIELDNLAYAERSLKEALTISPDNHNLRARAFQLGSISILREADYYGAQLPATYMEPIPALITEGFGLLATDLSNARQALVLGNLARLLQFDRSWKQPEAIGDLFEDALSLQPRNAEIAYWYGEYLINQESNLERGEQLIRLAVDIAPGNALYIAGLGRYYVESTQWREAFSAFQKAIELRSTQQTLQQIRASNGAGRALQRAIRAADENRDIESDDFFGLSMAKRVELINFTIENTHRDRYFYAVAARLLHAASHHEEAERLMRYVVEEYDDRTNTDHLQLLSSILQAQENPEAIQIKELLLKVEARSQYEEILEAGIEGGHRYKIGLRVSKNHQGDGVEVIKVYKDYPFAKAGVKKGDYLLEFAHRKIHNLRSVWVPINDFTPGTDVPLKIRRGNEIIEKTLIVE